MSDDAKTEAASPAAAPTDLQKRLHEARQRKIARDQAAQEEVERHELAVLELEEKLEAEGLGRCGTDFIVVDGGAEGPIGIKLGPSLLYTRFQAAMAGGKDPRPEDVFAYVFPCVCYPKPDAFKALNEKRPHLTMRCANALTVLFGAKEDTTRSKH